MRKAIHTDAGDQVDWCQKKKKSINITTMHHKVSKQHVRTFQIAVKPPASYNIDNINKTHTTQTKKTSIHNNCDNNNDDNIHVIANQLKQRLSKAMSKLAAANTTSTAIPTSPTTTLDELNKNEQKPSFSNSKPSSTTTTTTVTRPRLKNLTLLKQYLLFVAQESGTSVNIKSSDKGGHQIEIGIPEEQQKQKQKQQKIDDRCDAARLGARLIESHVHGNQSQIMDLISTPIKSELQEEKQQEKSNLDEVHSSSAIQKKYVKIKPEPPVLIKKEEKKSFSSPPLPKQQQQATPHWATRRSSLSDRRRRPGRPPASSSLKKWVEPPHRRRRSARNVMSYTSIVKCICDTPDEEYGSMVQCDDCQRWLHLDCLKMSEAVLGETFRCPLCFVALGKETNKLVSSMTWRFAARRQSEQLAAANSDDSETSDCEQEQHYHNHSINSTSSSIQNRRRQSRLQQQKFPQEQEQREELQQQQQQQQLELSIVAPERNMMEEDDDGHRSEDSSSSGSSLSEASTPEQTFYPTDPFDAMDTDFSNNNNNSQMILDSDSIEFFSRLIYLQSLDSMQKEIFAPNASDVFLCDDSDSSDSIVGNTLGHSRYPSTDTLPSSMCTQLLKEFSFDSGPFWKTMR